MTGEVRKSWRGLKHAAAVLEAAERWKQRCLLDGGSVFSGERLWSREHFEELRVHFVENPDSGSDPFYDKLRRQLDPAPPEAKRLWAEATWVFYLIVRGHVIRPLTKIDQIRRVWEWSGSPFPEDHWALREEVLTGVSHPGPAYNMHRWREFRFIVYAMIDVCLEGFWIRMVVAVGNRVTPVPPLRSVRAR